MLPRRPPDFDKFRRCLHSLRRRCRPSRAARDTGVIMRNWLTSMFDLLVTVPVTAVAIFPADCLAQATAITSSGLGTVVNQAGTTVTITGGSRSGANLFHSFGLFSVGTPDTARFTNTTGAGVTNVVGRVTGGEVSNIFGTIDTQTSMPGANLFLLNPAGMIFGPSARLNVSGSAHVSTGHYVGFSDGSKFFADPAQPLALPVANPVSFGFLTANPASITVNGSQLRIASGRTLSLVGGDVQVTG